MSNPLTEALYEFARAFRAGDLKEPIFVRLGSHRDGVEFLLRIRSELSYLDDLLEHLNLLDDTGAAFHQITLYGVTYTWPAED
jgi:hypothetical protein